jgi:hypothetical protein
MSFSKLLLLTLVALVFIPLLGYAGSINGLDPLLADSTHPSATIILNKLIEHHPMLHPANSERILELPRIGSNPTGIFLLSVVLLFAFSMVRLVFPRYYINLFQVFSGIASSKRHLKEQLESDNRASLWFYLIFYASAGYLLYHFVSMMNIRILPDNPIKGYALCTLLMTFLIGLKTTFIRLIGWIFNGKTLVHQYLLSIRLIIEILGLILFPLCILILISSGNFRSGVLLLALILCLLMVIYFYVRNIHLLRNLLHANVLHFLLYLCAFEVLPVLILIKMIR